MKERGSIFKGWGVKAIRNLQPGVWPAEAIDPALPIKWQTRRVVKGLIKQNASPCNIRFHDGQWQQYGAGGVWLDLRCPYGVPGDGLWIRENFYVQPEIWAQHHGPQPIHYAADSDPKTIEDYVQKPSIHMPRWASRDDLVVKEVRVEQVQEISEEDAIAEGMYRDSPEGCYHNYSQPELPFEWARTAFSQVWDDINYARGFGWEANPGVWVVSYMRKANQARKDV